MIAAAGRAVLHRAIGGRREMLERVLGQLKDDELRDTIRVLERLEQAINAAVAPGAATPAIGARP